ncbi:hypothetical protein EPO14_00095 [Patescibacteria group bacterium]|nr:MAG: hypothetical protein EPO14_00095 [Patescibacteria group bacterium]
MDWFFIALLGPLCWSIVHHLDKFLLNKLKKNHGIGSVMIFSCLFPVVLLPIFALIRPDVLSLSVGTIFALTITGVVGALAALFYFHALEDEEASVIVSMYQLLPIFGYILGFLVLGEEVGITKTIGSLVIIMGATILSFDFFEEARPKFKTKMVLFMIGASFFYALGDVIFKQTTLETSGYVPSIFWSFVGFVIFGILLFILVPKYRKDFLLGLKTRGRTLLGVNIANEVLQSTATMATFYAILLAPIALVLTLDAYQPAFVFIIGILLTLYFPKLVTEKITTNHLLQKIVAITAVILGTILIHL